MFRTDSLQLLTEGEQMQQQLATTIADACYGAANLLRKQGWGQGAYADFRGGRTTPCLCMSGGINKATSGHWDDTTSRVADRTKNFVSERVLDGLPVAEFNDYSCKTADDAIAALEIAGDIATCEGL
jgi:hypothetical protein